jgi:hypothetical protein
MKNKIQTLHEQHKLIDSPVKVYLVHKFDSTTKSWKFDGYRCVLCGSNFKQANTVEKHKNTCRELNKGVRRSYGADNPKLVITIKGEVWKPLDVNTL